MIELECLCCKKKFKVYKYRKNTAKYCSRQCAGSAKCGIKKDSIRQSVDCAFCGKTIQKWPCEIKDKNYCSRKCHGLSKQTGKHIECSYCKKLIWRTESGMFVNNYCNPICQYSYIKENPFASPNWKGGKVETFCIFCKKSFSHDINEDRKYCSQKCYGLSKRTEVPVGCLICKKEYTINKARYLRSKHNFCSNKCHGLYLSSKKVLLDCKSCEYCKIIFRPRQRDGANKYCSTYCYRLASRIKDVATRCNECGIEFKKKRCKYERDRYHFCSKNCLHKFQKGKNHPTWKDNAIERICENCNKEFVKPKNRERQHRFCSIKCYSEYVRGERHFAWRGGPEPYCRLWTNKEYKQDIRNRDNNRCSNPSCFKGKRLVVHHINYDKKDCTLKNLITICNSCNSAANYNRGWHKSWYQAIMNKRYGYKYE